MINCVMSSFSLDNLYLLLEKSVAEREVFKDFLLRQKLRKKGDKSIDIGEGCRFSFTQDFDFASLPFAMTMAKGHPELMDILNQM